MARLTYAGCGDRIRKLRKSLDLTQRQLADLAGLCNVSICHYETGARVPNRATMESLAEALGTSAAYLREEVPAYQAGHAPDYGTSNQRIDQVVALSRKMIARVARVPEEFVIIRVRPVEKP